MFLRVLNRGIIYIYIYMFDVNMFSLFGGSSDFDAFKGGLKRITMLQCTLTNGSQVFWLLYEGTILFQGCMRGTSGDLLIQWT